jgi:spore maturation protein SpmA
LLLPVKVLLDLVLPLMAYLLFCGLMELLIISGASKIKSLKSCFLSKYFRVSQNHPSISYMTLNFAANFLGLDSAATPLIKSDGEPARNKS